MIKSLFFTVTLLFIFTVSIAGSATIGDEIGSWWALPRASTVGDYIYFGGTKSNGYIVAHRTTISTDVTESFNLATGSTVDDHKTPAILASEGKPTIAFYYGHNTSDYLYYRVSSTNGGIDYGAQSTIVFPDEVTYAQVYNTSGDNIIVFTRIGSRYWYIATSADWGATWSTPTALFDGGFDEQIYIGTVKAGNTIRIAITGHPTSSDIHNIYYCYLDLTNNNLYSVGGTLIGNLSDAPFDVTTELPIAYPQPSGRNLRMFDLSSGPAPEIALGTWTNDTDTYYEYLVWNGTDWVKHDIVAAGAVFGYVPSVHYNGGISFPNPTSGGSLFLSRESSGVWNIEKYNLIGADNWTVDQILSSDTKKLVRPSAIVGIDGLVYYDISSYVDYTDFIGDTVVLSDLGDNPLYLYYSISSGDYLAPQNVTVSPSRTATIHCTTDGTVPNESSPVYAGPFRVGQNVKSATVKCFAKDAAGNTSEINSLTCRFRRCK